MPGAMLLTPEQQEETLENMVRRSEQVGWVRNGGVIDNGPEGIQQDMYKKGKFGKVTAWLSLTVGMTGHFGETARYLPWWFFEDKGYQLFLATLATAATICAAAAAIATCTRPLG